MTEIPNSDVNPFKSIIKISSSSFNELNVNIKCTLETNTINIKATHVIHSNNKVSIENRNVQTMNAPNLLAHSVKGLT